MSDQNNQPLHQPVMLAEAIDGLAIKPGAWYLDGTFGRGGHTAQILTNGGRVIAFDVDEEAIAYGQQRFESAIGAGTLILIRANFDQLLQEVQKLHQAGTVTEIHGALFDFGTSVDQLVSPERGFSFQFDAELDMRLDQRLGVKAADLLALLSEKQLAQLFAEQGGEPDAKKIAKAIVAARKNDQLAEIQTTVGLANLIVKNKRFRPGHLNPATKVFQALRIAVNNELDSIAVALRDIRQILTSPARIVTIAFHEGEDRIVKQLFVDWQNQGLGQNLTKHPLTPSQEELTVNQRARSAKLRIFEL